MEDRIAHFADIDTRRAMGIPPGKLTPSDFRVPIGNLLTTYDYEPSGVVRMEVKHGIKCTLIRFFDSRSMIKACEMGEITWYFGITALDSMRYDHSRPKV